MVGWHVVEAALHIVACRVVTKDRTEDEAVKFQVGVPVSVAVEFVPASVIVIVHGAVVDVV